MSQINETTRGAYQFLIDAAIILYFIPFLYMFAAVIKLARRKDRKENPHAVLVPGGIAGVWICGGLGFLVVLIGIVVSLVPPGDSANKVGFELKLVGGTAASVRWALCCTGAVRDPNRVSYDLSNAVTKPTKLDSSLIANDAQLSRRRWGWCTVAAHLDSKSLLFVPCSSTPAIESVEATDVRRKRSI